MKTIKSFLIFMAALFTTACASNVHQNISQPIEAQPGKIQNISLSISAEYTVVKDAGYLKSVEELRNEISKKLKIAMPSSHLMTEETSESGIKVNLIIENFRYVSGASRFLTGVMVGRAQLRVRAELISLPGGQKIGEQTLSTSSSASEGIFGGTTSRQIESVAESVVTMLKSIEK